MRLRQLALSQSVVFYAPPEVHQSIVNFRHKTSKDTIDSHDVIAWLLEQTCCNIEQLQPLYISQGLEYCRKFIATKKFNHVFSSIEHRRAFLNVLEQPEQFSLEKLYAPDQKIQPRVIDAAGFPQMLAFIEKLQAMRGRMRNTGDAVQALAHQEVEQEREVQIEVVRIWSIIIHESSLYCACVLVDCKYCANPQSGIGDSSRGTKTGACTSTSPIAFAPRYFVLCKEWTVIRFLSCLSAGIPYAPPDSDRSPPGGERQCTRIPAVYEPRLQPYSGD